jgi:hypothetical protein
MLTVAGGNVKKRGLRAISLRSLSLIFDTAMLIPANLSLPN